MTTQSLQATAQSVALNTARVARAARPLPQRKLRRRSADLPTTFSHLMTCGRLRQCTCNKRVLVFSWNRREWLVHQLSENKYAVLLYDEAARRSVACENWQCLIFCAEANR